MNSTNHSASGLKFDVSRATDAEEASALGYSDSYIDVYSNSWGPADFGFFVSGPGTLVQSTLRTGVTEVCVCSNKTATTNNILSYGVTEVYACV